MINPFGKLQVKKKKKRGDKKGKRRKGSKKDKRYEKSVDVWWAKKRGNG